MKIQKPQPLNQNIIIPWTLYIKAYAFSKITMREESHALDTKNYREKSPLKDLIDYIDKTLSFTSIESLRVFDWE